MRLLHWPRFKQNIYNCQCSSADVSVTKFSLVSVSTIVSDIALFLFYPSPGWLCTRSCLSVCLSACNQFF